jgi:hypothetical protein
MLQLFIGFFSTIKSRTAQTPKQMRYCLNYWDGPERTSCEPSVKKRFKDSCEARGAGCAPKSQTLRASVKEKYVSVIHKKKLSSTR